LNKYNLLNYKSITKALEVWFLDVHFSSSSMGFGEALGHFQTDRTLFCGWSSFSNIEFKRWPFSEENGLVFSCT
jgi:hypothetical protein